MSRTKRIVILGPESTGKSQLSKDLAGHYKTPWVPEFAREYIDQLHRPYQKEDLQDIAKGQLSLEDEMASKTSDFLFCDTNLIVIKVWSDFKYGDTDPWILASLENRKYDFYLLTDIDLPWKDDPQREHPNKRAELFNIYESYLEDHDLPFGIVSGSGDDRLKNAIRLIDSRF